MLLNWTLGTTVRGAQGAKDVHHAIGISHQRNSGYRPSRVNISWHKVSPLPSPIPSLSPYTPLSKKWGHATTTHIMRLMVLHNTTVVTSLGLHTGPACKAGLSSGKWMEHVPPHRRNKERQWHTRQNNHETQMKVTKFTQCSRYTLLYRLHTVHENVAVYFW